MRRIAPVSRPLIQQPITAYLPEYSSSTSAQLGHANSGNSVGDDGLLGLDSEVRVIRQATPSAACNARAHNCNSDRHALNFPPLQSPDCKQTIDCLPSGLHGEVSVWRQSCSAPKMGCCGSLARNVDQRDELLLQGAVLPEALAPPTIACSLYPYLCNHEEKEQAL